MKPAEVIRAERAAAEKKILDILIELRKSTGFEPAGIEINRVGWQTAEQPRMQYDLGGIRITLELP